MVRFQQSKKADTLAYSTHILKQVDHMQLAILVPNSKYLDVLYGWNIAQRKT